MRKILFISLISLILIPGLNLSAQAEIATTRVTSDSCEDGMPQIKGNYAVWQRYVNGDWEVFLLDLTTGLIQQITNNDYYDISPGTDGRHVVWMGGVNSGGEIFVHSIASGQSTQITNNANADSFPQIANGQVVWTSEATGSIGFGEIILYDIETGVSKQLTHNTADDRSPRINSQSVIWIQTDQNDKSTLMLYDILQGTVMSAPDDFVWEDSPQTDGDLTVSMTNDGDDWEIVVCNKAQKDLKQITNNSLYDTHPRISGDSIVWMGGQGKDSDIYVALYGAENGLIVDRSGLEMPASSDEQAGSEDDDSEKSSGSCFVATSACGSLMEPNEQLLRDIGDTYLLHTRLGRLFVNAYCRIFTTD